MRVADVPVVTERCYVRQLLRRVFAPKARG